MCEKNTIVHRYYFELASKFSRRTMLKPEKEKKKNLSRKKIGSYNLNLSIFTCVEQVIFYG